MFTQIEARISQVEGMMIKLDAMAEGDAEAVRKSLAESKLGSRTFRGSKDISEYKAIQNLTIIPENKTEFKIWQEKLKSAMVQTRGVEWKQALDAIDMQEIKEDYEDESMTGDAWDNWFSIRFVHINRCLWGLRLPPLPPTQIRYFGCNL